MTKVKMDVIRPWIADGATDLLRFEYEVLINFVYRLLEGKGKFYFHAVDEKKIKIHVKGFMKKTTRNFMKEEWGLLLSLENNASGVPQQFLDAFWLPS